MLRKLRDLFFILMGLDREKYTMIHINQKPKTQKPQIKPPGQHPIKKVLEVLLQKSSGINTEWSPTQDKIGRATEQILAITKPEIDEDKVFIILRENLCHGTTDCENNPECIHEGEEDGCPPNELAYKIATSDVFKEEK